MNTRYVLSQYIENALDRAEYEKLEDTSYSGSIRDCPGVIAFASSLRDCERELQSVLEDWLLLGLKLGHRLPIIGGIDLNKDMTHAQVDPCNRQDFVRRLRQLGFDGVFSGAKHQFMLIGQNRLTLPSNAEYSAPQLRMMLRQVEAILGREITLDEWSRLS